MQRHGLHVLLKSKNQSVRENSLREKNAIMTLKYKVEVKETLSRIVEVDADSENDAVEKVSALYEREEIVLGADDYVDTDINIYKDE